MREHPTYNYEALKSYIARGRNKRERPTDKPSLRVRLYGTDVMVKMYDTYLARFKPDGTIVLNMGRWEDSFSTRANVAEIVGVSVYTIAQHKKRMVSQSTRIYAGYQSPHGLPYADGCIVKHGTCIWHPEMKEQGIDDIGLLTEECKVVNTEKAKPYYAKRKALAKLLRPMYGFVDAKSLEGVYQPFNPTQWFEGILDEPPTDEERYKTLLQLVAMGCPERHNTWKKGPEFNVGTVAGFVQKGVAKCAGPSSWDILDEIGAIDTTNVLCKDI